MARNPVLQPPPPPHEHGAWAMLVIPLLLGLAFAGAPQAAGLLVVPAMTLVFFARYAALPAAVRLAGGKPVPPGFVARRFVWTGVYLSGAIACFAGAILLAPAGVRGTALSAAAVTAALGGIHTALVFGGADRSVGGELIGMAGLASAAPLVAAASGLPLNGRAIGTSALAMAYFVSSLAFVRAYRAPAEARGKAAAACTGVHLLLVAALVALERLGWVPLWGLLAFAPVLARTVWGLARPPKNLKVLGWREAVVATVYGLGTCAALLL